MMWLRQQVVYRGDNIKVEEGGKINRDEVIGDGENYKKYMFIHCSFI